MHTVIIGILDDADIIRAAIEAVPDIYAVRQDVGIGGRPGDVIGITDVPSFSASGGGDGQGGVNGVVDDRCARALAGERRQP